jgi:hypothetical protein
MAWHDYLAAVLFVAAAIYVARRAYCAVSGRANAGCGSGCGSCSSAQTNAQPADLLTIGTPPIDQRL